ncbi:hypothetical protein [Halobacillus massiliensis]|uniref:hypothetical protein n=1 Tax=Halobacillus massiliensis TaxID=1926286 RepID=UPI0009E45644|nr:hypothetical protein [Halobacillus massiliensis]
MGEYEIFVEEKQQIDQLIEKGFRIVKVTENLDGALVDFQKGEEKEQLAIKNAETRKYFTTLILKQADVKDPAR